MYSFYLRAVFMCVILVPRYKQKNYKNLDIFLILDYTAFISYGRHTYNIGRKDIKYAGTGKESPGEDILNQF